MKVVLAGATGFIGEPLVGALVAAGHEAAVLTRDPQEAPESLSSARFVAWDGRTVDPSWAKELDGAEAVINLAGANIGAKRWSDERRRELLESRVHSTGAIVAAMGEVPAERRPKVLVNASGIDYYGDRGDETVVEESVPGDTFLAQLCVQWEAAAKAAETRGVRVVLMRTSLVIGRGAEALNKLTLPFKLFAGGPLGSGKQWFSWIHLDDVVGLYRLAIENSAVVGPLNAVAPDVRREAAVAREVGRVLHRPSWAPAPAFALRLALGKQAELVLHGRRAEPRKALALGYQFKYPQLNEALTEALG